MQYYPKLPNICSFFDPIPLILVIYSHPSVNPIPGGSTLLAWSKRRFATSHFFRAMSSKALFMAVNPSLGIGWRPRTGEVIGDTPLAFSLSYWHFKFQNSPKPTRKIKKKNGGRFFLAPCWTAEASKKNIASLSCQLCDRIFKSMVDGKGKNESKKKSGVRPFLY